MFTVTLFSQKVASYGFNGRLNYRHNVQFIRHDFIQNRSKNLL
jgi:hypothetical protein